MLIHQLSGATAGKFNELQTEMKNLNSFMKNVRHIYLNNTNLDEKTLNSLLETDIWLDSITSLNYGLVDKVL